MTAKTDTLKRYSLEEYLVMEEIAEHKHEFYNGQITTMAGAKETHNAICANLIFSLAQKIRIQEELLFKLYTSDMKVWLPKKQSIVYPDALVVSKPPQFYKGRKDILTNPFLIAEVLSNSTKEYDQKDKFELYKSVESFQEYVLISQEEKNIIVFSKQENNKWVKCEFNAMTEVISLPNIGFEIQMNEVYFDITFN